MDQVVLRAAISFAFMQFEFDSEVFLQLHFNSCWIFWFLRHFLGSFYALLGLIIFDFLTFNLTLPFLLFTFILWSLNLRNSVRFFTFLLQLGSDRINFLFQTGNFRLQTRDIFCLPAHCCLILNFHLDFFISESLDFLFQVFLRDLQISDLLQSNLLVILLLRKLSLQFGRFLLSLELVDLLH